ncbi:hypothetical protein HMPREF9436_01722 [Faecalibacterium cf. prausnitzii KLE1255]|uniref:Uncharacterized protein n=1 Tax=Faecalibacterium cf. prausnitzii KLE1255 TaxID=748224 RepID=E2ZJ75_9FIRM|nr:hypothetical protein HMPREF9436_01722 [Faecalibacterium cf. prausnitzii KLE1255]
MNCPISTTFSLSLDTAVQGEYIFAWHTAHFAVFKIGGTP